MFSYPKVVPDLVEDVSLKRARGEDGTIKTSPEALGKVDDAAWDGTNPEATVISLLKGIVNKLQWFYIEIYDKTRPPTPTKITKVEFFQGSDGTIIPYASKTEFATDTSNTFSAYAAELYLKQDTIGGIDGTRVGLVINGSSGAQTGTIHAGLNFYKTFTGSQITNIIWGRLTLDNGETVYLNDYWESALHYSYLFLPGITFDPADL